MSDIPQGYELVPAAPPRPVAITDIPPGYEIVPVAPPAKIGVQQRADANKAWPGSLRTGMDALSGFTELGNAFRDVTDAAGSAATFGLADIVSPAGRAAVQKMMGAQEGFPDLYFRNREQERGKHEAFKTENPNLNALANVAGYATPVAPVLGAARTIAGVAPTLTRLMGTGAVTGGGIGTVSGLAESPHTDAAGMARDAGIGAGVGATVGGLVPAGVSLASPLVRALIGRINPNAVNQQAAGLVGNRISQDAAAGGPNANAMRTALSANPNLSLMDVGGENTQALAGRMSRMQGEPRQTITDFLNTRDASAGNRLTAAVDARIASGGPTFTSEQALMRQRAQDTKPLWDDFYAAPPLNPDTIAAGGELDKMMTRPAMVKASNNALSLAKEEGRDPASLGITFNVAGDPVFERVPSWQTLDYVKRGLDDVLNGHRDSTTGRLVRDEGVNAIESTMRTFREFIDRHNPAYAPARAAWSGPSQSIAAMKQGSGFANMAPDRIAYEIGRLDAGDRDFYRLGAANALKSQIAGKGPGGNEALALMGNKTRQDQLAAIFPDQASFQRFMQEVANPEAQMFRTRQSVIGGSDTGRRIAEDRTPSFGDMVAPAAVSIAQGHPLPMLASLLPRVMSFVRHENNPRVNAAAAQMLATADPAANAATLAQILALNGQRPLSPAFGAPAAALGGSAYPRLDAPGRQ